MLKTACLKKEKYARTTGSKDMFGVQNSVHSRSNPYYCHVLSQIGNDSSMDMKVRAD